MNLSQDSKLDVNNVFLAFTPSEMGHEASGYILTIFFENVLAVFHIKPDFEYDLVYKSNVMDPYNQIPLSVSQVKFDKKELIALPMINDQRVSHKLCVDYFALCSQHGSRGNQQQRKMT